MYAKCAYRTAHCRGGAGPAWSAEITCMTRTYMVFRVDIGTGFDDDINASSMAICSGLHEGGVTTLHNWDMIRGGEVVLSKKYHIHCGIIQTGICECLHMRDRPYGLHAYRRQHMCSASVRQPGVRGRPRHCDTRRIFATHTTLSAVARRSR